MSASVTITHLRYVGVAECEGYGDLDPDSTREQCRAHVRQTGHKVRFSVEDVTKYQPQEGGEQ